jgi:hypothetical protein
MASFRHTSPEPEPIERTTPTDDGNAAPLPPDLDETTGGLLCGKSSFRIIDTRQVPNGLPHLPTSSLPRLTPLLLAIFVMRIIAVSLLGIGLLRLTKILHRDIVFVAMVTVLFVLAGAIGALYVFYHLTDTQREVL